MLGLRDEDIIQSFPWYPSTSSISYDHLSIWWRGQYQGFEETFSPLKTCYESLQSDAYRWACSIDMVPLSNRSAGLEIVGVADRWWLLVEGRQRGRPQRWAGTSVEPAESVHGGTIFLKEGRGRDGLDDMLRRIKCMTRLLRWEVEVLKLMSAYEILISKVPLQDLMR